MLIALAGGIVVGLLIGMLGGGGAILSIPLLVYALGFSAHEATASSLVIVGAGALTGIITQHRQGNLDLKRGGLFGVLGLAGSSVASKISAGIDENLLLTLFAALLALVALTMLLKIRQKKNNSPHPPQASSRQTSVSNCAPLAHCNRRRVFDRILRGRREGLHRKVQPLSIRYVIYRLFS